MFKGVHWKDIKDAFFDAFFRLIFIISVFVGLIDQVHAYDVTTYIPVNAIKILPIVQTQQNETFPENPIQGYMGALIEQESCISLTHPKCWSPTSELNTSREEGLGLLQITKAFNKTGGVRFDTLKDLKKKYPEQLEEMSWDTLAERPDLQIRAGLLMIKDNYDALKMIPNAYDRMAMTDSAYNGGLRYVNKARTACAMSRGCNPNIWFHNVEEYLPQSRAAIYGDRSPFDINVEHVQMDLQTRLWKYRPYLY